MDARTVHARRTPGIKTHGPGGDDDDDDEERLGSVSPRPLPPLARLYVYALHGCLCEVVFTAACDWFDTRDRRLAGHSSLWALPMYATAIYLMERLGTTLSARAGLPLPARMIAYTAFIYLWEFTWGVGLRTLGACPWDYSGHTYHLWGLVTLEYAVPWAVASLLAEKCVIRNTLRIRLVN